MAASLSNFKKRIFLGVSANLLGEVLNLLSRLLLPPLFLACWGAEKYGHWLILSSFAMSFSLANLGTHIGMVNLLTQANAREDLPRARSILHSGLWLYMFLGGTCMAVFLMILRFFPLAGIFPSIDFSANTAYVVLAVLGFQVCWGIAFGSNNQFYRAIGRYTRGVMNGNAKTFLGLSFTIAALLAGFDMPGLAVLSTAPYVLVPLWTAFDFHCLAPELRMFRPFSVNRETLKLLWRPSLHFFGLSLAQMFSIQGMVMVAGSFLSAEAVVVFTTHRTLVASLRRLMAMTSHALWPEFTQLEASGQRERFTRLFRWFLGYNMVAALGASLLLLVGGEKLFTFWLGGKIAFSWLTMRLFLLYFLQNVFWTTFSHCLMSINRHENLTAATLASAIVPIVVFVSWAHQFGIHGMIVSMTVGEALSAGILVPLDFFRHFSFREVFCARTPAHSSPGMGKR